MKISALGIAALSGCVAGTCMGKSNSDRPNVIYILADDMGYGDLGCYGQKIIKTPNIDKLAKEGMLFTQHYAGCTVSAPSRSSLMTGLHTGHTHIRGNLNHGTEGDEPLKAGTFTIARMMKDEGYKTGIFGKWGLGYPGSEGVPQKMGFDEFFGYNCQRQAHHYYPYHLWHNDEKVVLDGNKGANNNEYAQDLIQQKALDFITENKDKRFFLYLPYILPHAELTSPQDSILQKYKGKIAPGKKYNGVENPNDRSYKYGGYGTSNEPHADFASMITRFDAYVGDIIALLKKEGLDKNTIVFFTSDNGPHCEGGADPEFFNSYGPLRGIKRDMYEGGVRVPLIAWAPGRIRENSRTDHICAFWDMMPTLGHIVGNKSLKPSDGISFAPILFGKKNQKKHEFLYWEFHEDGGKIGVRMGDWKGIKLNYSDSPDAPMFLYNLRTDIHEDKNVATAHPEIVKRIERIIDREHVKSEIFPYKFEK